MKSILLIFFVLLEICHGGEITLSDGRLLCFKTIPNDEGVISAYQISLRDGESEEFVWSQQRFISSFGLEGEFAQLHGTIISFFEDEREVTILIASDESGGMLFHIDKEKNQFSRPIHRLWSFWRSETLWAWSLSGHNQMTYDPDPENSPREVFTVSQDGRIKGFHDDVVATVVGDQNDQITRTSSKRRRDRTLPPNVDSQISDQKNEREKAVEDKSLNISWIITGVLFLGTLFLALKMLKGKTAS